MKNILLVGLISLMVTMSTMGCDAFMVAGTFDDLGRKLKKDAPTVELKIDAQIDKVISYRFEIDALYLDGVMPEKEYVANIQIADRAKEYYADDKDFTDLLDSLERTVIRYSK